MPATTKKKSKAKPPRLKWLYLNDGTREAVLVKDYATRLSEVQASGPKTRKGTPLSQSTLRRRYTGYSKGKAKRDKSGRFVSASAEYTSKWYTIETSKDNGDFIASVYDVAKLIGYETRNGDISIDAEWESDGVKHSDFDIWLFVYSEQKPKWHRWIDMALTARKSDADLFAAFTSLENAATASSRYINAENDRSDKEYNLGDIENLRARFTLGPVDSL